MMTDPVNLLLLLTSLAGLVSLLVLGSLARSGIPGIADCLCSTMLLIVATLLFSLRGRAPDFFSLVLANACMLGAICALYGGCRRLFGLPVRYAKLGVASALILAGVSYFHYVHQDISLATWRPGESLDRLLARADQGLYVAKQAGRNRIVSVGEQEAGLPGFISGGYRAS